MYSNLSRRHAYYLELFLSTYNDFREGIVRGDTGLLGDPNSKTGS